MCQAKAAVITTLYAGDSIDFFSESLASIVAQDYPASRRRIYLYVDGPVPKSHEHFLHQNRSTFYRIYRSPTNRGLAHGLNTLIEALEDEAFVLRMDMDDIAHPHRVRKQIEFLQNNPELAMIGCNSLEIDENGNVVSHRDYPATPEAIRETIARGNPMLHPTYCLRREVLTVHGLRYRKLYLNEDLGFLFDVLAKGLKPGNIQERLLYWRVTDKFFERRHCKRHFAEFRAYVAGIYRLFGLTPKYIYPGIRLMFRFLPNTVARRVYCSGLRNGFLRG